MSQPKTERNHVIANMVAERRETLEQIGARYGLTRERVRQIAESAGIRRGSGCLRTTDPELLKVAYAYIDRGMPLAHVAKTVQISENSLRRNAQKDGVYFPYPAPSEWTETETEFLKARYKQPGWSASKIGEALGGRSRNEVIGRAFRLGLTSRIADADRRRCRLERQEQIKMLRHNFGMALADIAQTLNVPKGTVSAEYWRAMNPKK